MRLLDELIKIKEESNLIESIENDPEIRPILDRFKDALSKGFMAFSLETSMRKVKSISTEDFRAYCESMGIYFNENAAYSTDEKQLLIIPDENCITSEYYKIFMESQKSKKAEVFKDIVKQLKEAAGLKRASIEHRITLFYKGTFSHGTVLIERYVKEIENDLRREGLNVTYTDVFSNNYCKGMEYLTEGHSFKEDMIWTRKLTISGF